MKRVICIVADAIIIAASIFCLSLVWSIATSPYGVSVSIGFYVLGAGLLIILAAYSVIDIWRLVGKRGKKSRRHKSVGAKRRKRKAADSNNE